MADEAPPSIADKVSPSKADKFIDVNMPPPTYMVPPKEFTTCLPPDDCSVSDLLGYTMPPLLTDTTCPAETASAAISHLNPAFTMDDIFTADIPPVKWMKAVEARVEEHQNMPFRSANTSIIHPVDRKLRFPTWILKAWFELCPIAAEYHRWMKVTQFIGDRQNTILANQARELLARAPRRINNEDISRIALFASTEWLRDRQFEIIGDVLNATFAPKVWVCPSSLATKIRKIAQADGPAGLLADQNLTDFVTYLVHGGYTWLFLPILVYSNHWVLFEVNMAESTIAWGALCKPYLPQQY